MNVKIGDLIKDFKEEKIYVIAHGCNCFNTMGAGVAAQISREFPEAYAADCETSKGDYNKLGNYTHVSYGPKKWIFNAYTQYHYNKPYPLINYHAMYLALKKIRKNFPDHISMGVPLIGNGLAGGQIEKVVSTMFDALCGTNSTIYVYHKDPNAKEMENYIKTFLSGMGESRYVPTEIKERLSDTDLNNFLKEV